MIASLPMYDHPRTGAAHDRYWALIRDHLREAGNAAPDVLTRTGDPWDHWQSPELILSQTCGFPYRAKLHGKVALVGTPDYGLPGCAPGYYNSTIVVRNDDPRASAQDFVGASAAYNEAMSQSGWAALSGWAADAGITLGPKTRTGGHALSAACVAEGRAELAAIDAQTWTMIQQWEDTSTLRVLERTTPTPGLPYITAPRRDPAPIAAAVRAAIAALDPRDRDLLNLTGFEAIPASAYLAVPTPPAP